MNMTDPTNYISWEKVDRLLKWKDMDTRACPHCLQEMEDADTQGLFVSDAGIEVYLGKGRWTNIDCKRADKLQQLKDCHEKVSRETSHAPD